MTKTYLHEHVQDCFLVGSTKLHCPGVEGGATILLLFVDILLLLLELFPLVLTGVGAELVVDKLPPLGVIALVGFGVAAPAGLGVEGAMLVGVGTELLVPLFDWDCC